MLHLIYSKPQLASGGKTAANIYPRVWAFACSCVALVRRVGGYSALVVGIAAGDNYYVLFITARRWLSRKYGPRWFMTCGIAARELGFVLMLRVGWPHQLLDEAAAGRCVRSQLGGDRCHDECRFRYTSSGMIASAVNNMIAALRPHWHFSWSGHRPTGTSFLVSAAPSCVARDHLWRPAASLQSRWHSQRRETNQSSRQFIIPVILATLAQSVERYGRVARSPVSVPTGGSIWLRREVSTQRQYACFPKQETPVRLVSRKFPQQLPDGI